jgi:hypothetical protein
MHIAHRTTLHTYVRATPSARQRAAPLARSGSHTQVTHAAALRSLLVAVGIGYEARHRYLFIWITTNCKRAPSGAVS